MFIVLHTTTDKKIFSNPDIHKLHNRTYVLYRHTHTCLLCAIAKMKENGNGKEKKNKKRKMQGRKQTNPGNLIYNKNS